MDAGWSNIWTTPAFKNYLKFITVNIGLNGAFISATPREFIEGYNDPLIETLISMPVYEGGDQTRSPFLALDMPTYHPVDNPIVFMTGADDSKNTRQYIKWLNNTDLWIQANDYESISKIIPAPFQPWTTPTPILGTDGF